MSDNEENPGVKPVLRIIILLIIMPAAFFFTYWIPCTLILNPFFGNEHSQLAARFRLTGFISFFVALGVGWYVWKKLGAISQGRVSGALLGAAILGAFGFCAGFFGPMIFAPGANQGPLLGLFITGPLGFLLGAIAGFIYPKFFKFLTPDK
ncbi:MAG: hypothetical protein NTX59_05820 [Elusimicrobia bacterium]|nr:hypothetical protein [Elusimicrobiota bacterium]